MRGCGPARTVPPWPPTPHPAVPARATHSDSTPDPSARWVASAAGRPPTAAAVVLAWVGGRRLPRRARPARRARAVRRRLAGRWLGVRGGPPSDRSALRRSGQLCARRGDQLADARQREPGLPRDDSPRRRACCGATPPSQRCGRPGPSRRTAAWPSCAAAQPPAQPTWCAPRVASAIGSRRRQGRESRCRSPARRGCGRSSTRRTRPRCCAPRCSPGRSRWPCSPSPSARSPRPGSRWLLAILGLVATAGALWIGAQFTGITIWAMNFALMFALAVGIDYALFVVVRFRAALRAGLRPDDAVAETMDSAGKAVLVSGVAVLAALAAVMVVPSQPFRTSALGILLAVGFVLAASLTLLPALLARLGPRIDRFALPWAGAVQHRSEAFARWGRLIWRRPVVIGGLALVALVALALRGARPAHGDADDRRPARRRERARRLRAPAGGLRRRGARRAAGRGAGERVRARARGAPRHARRGRREPDGAAGRPRADTSASRLGRERVRRQRALTAAGRRARRRRGRRGPRSRARPRGPASARLRPGGRRRLCAAGHSSSAHRSPPRRPC